MPTENSVTITVNGHNYQITDAQPNPRMVGTDYAVMDYVVYYSKSESLLPELQTLLNRGANANQKFPYAFTANYQQVSYLMYALMQNDTELAKLLLAYGATPSQYLPGPMCGVTIWTADKQKAWGGYTSLGLAAHYKNYEIAKELIKKGVDPRLMFSVTAKESAFTLTSPFATTLLELADGYKLEGKYYSAVCYYYLAGLYGSHSSSSHVDVLTISNKIVELIHHHLTPEQILTIAMNFTSKLSDCYFHDATHNMTRLNTSKIVGVLTLRDGEQTLDRGYWYRAAINRNAGVKKAIAEVCDFHLRSNINYDFVNDIRSIQSSHNLPPVIVLTDGVHALNLEIVNSNPNLVYYYLALSCQSCNKIKAAEYIDNAHEQGSNEEKARIYFNAGNKHNSTDIRENKIEAAKCFYKASQIIYLGSENLNSYASQAKIKLQELFRFNPSYFLEHSLAKFILEQGDQENAFIYFEVASVNPNSAEAAYYCGQYHMQHLLSSFAPLDLIKAATYYNQALTNGYQAAQEAIDRLFNHSAFNCDDILIIAKMFFDNQNQVEAKRWFERVDQYASAKYHLGRYHQEGLASTPINLLTAAEYFLSAILLVNDGHNTHETARTSLVTLMNEFDIEALTILLNRFLAQGEQLLESLQPQLSIATRAKLLMLRGTRAIEAASYASAAHYFQMAIRENPQLIAAQEQYDTLLNLQLPFASLLNIAKILFPQFKQAAWIWITKAKELADEHEIEDAELYHLIGEYYQFGHQPVEVNQNQTVLAYAKSISLGSHEANVNLENIRSAPNIHPEALTALGTLLLENNYEQLAKPFYLKAAESNHGEAYWCLGVQLQQTLTIENIADFPQVVSYYEKAIEYQYELATFSLNQLLEDFLPHVVAIGRVYQERGEREKALLWYRKGVAQHFGQASWYEGQLIAQTLSHATPEAYPEVLDCYQQAVANNCEEARQSLLELLETFSGANTPPATFVRIAQVYQAADNIEVAIEWLNKAIERRFAAGYYWKAKYLEQLILDEGIESLRHYRNVIDGYLQALSLDPEYTQAEEALNQFRNRFAPGTAVTVAQLKMIGSLYIATQELTTAKIWFLRAAELHDSEAYFWLGDYYCDIARDFPEEPNHTLTAIKYYIHALQYGCIRARGKITNLLTINEFNAETILSIAKWMHTANLHKMAKPLFELAMTNNLAEAYLYYGNYINPDYVATYTEEQIADETIEAVYRKDRRIAGLVYCRAALAGHENAITALINFVNHQTTSDEELEGIVVYLEEENPAWLPAHREQINEGQYTRIRILQNILRLKQSHAIDAVLIDLNAAATILPEEVANKLTELYHTLDDPIILRRIGAFYLNPEQRPDLLQQQLNIVEPNQWILRAEEKENHQTVSAMLQLGNRRLAQGEHSAENYAIAFNWYQKALEKAQADNDSHGISQAAHMQGKCYENGHGVAIDLYLAARLYITAYRHGSNTVSEDIDRILANPVLTKSTVKQLERELLIAQAHLTPNNFLNHRNTSGKTALHRAAKRSYKDFARLLFLGASNTVPDHEGNPPITQVENPVKAMESFRKLKSSINHLQKNPHEIIMQVVTCDNLRRREEIEAIFTAVSNNPYVEPLLNFAKLHILNNIKNNHNQLSICISSHPTYALFNENTKPIYQLTNNKITIYSAPEALDRNMLTKKLMAMLAIFIAQNVFTNNGLPYRPGEELQLMDIKNALHQRLDNFSPRIKAMLCNCFYDREDMKHVIPSIVKYIVDNKNEIYLLTDEVPEVWRYFNEVFVLAVKDYTSQMEHALLNGYDKQWFETAIRENSKLLEDDLPSLTFNCRIC